MGFSQRIIFLLVVLSLIGCQNGRVSADAADHTVQLADPIGEMLLPLGEGVKVKRRGDELFTFAEVVEDSRCPRGVDCIQAGRARVALLVLEEGEFRRRVVTVEGGQTLRLATGGLEVLGLDPYPDARVRRAGPVTYRLRVRLTE